MTLICVSKLSILDSDNGLSPGRHQAIIGTNAGILLIEPLGTNFSEILNETHRFSFKKMRLKMSSAKWRPFCLGLNVHYNDVIMDTIASQITSLTIVYSTVYSDADQRKYQSSASLAFVRGIHRRPVNSPHTWPVTRKMFPFVDVIMLIWFIYPYTPGSFTAIWIIWVKLDTDKSQQAITKQRLRT